MANRYREIISFHPLIRFLYLIMLAVLVFHFAQAGRGSSLPVPVLLVSVLLVVFPSLFGRLVIELDETSLTMSWGYIRWRPKKIPLSSIEKSEIITYQPIRQFGGWGIRRGRVGGQTTGCYSLRGNRGVLLTLNTDLRVALARTRQFLVGSQEPEKLLQALNI